MVPLCEFYINKWKMEILLILYIKYQNRIYSRDLQRQNTSWLCFYLLKIVFHIRNNSIYVSWSPKIPCISKNVYKSAQKNKMFLIFRDIIFSFSHICLSAEGFLFKFQNLQQEMRYRQKTAVILFSVIIPLFSFFLKFRKECDGYFHFLFTKQ